MTRILASLSIATLLTAAAQAQCPQGTTAGLVKWTSGSGYAATNPLDDESITSPPIALTAFANFPMAGAVGNLDQMWVNCNGEIYLTDSTLALTQPVNGASFGVNTIAEMRGTAVGASARVVCLGGDHQASAVAGSSWNVSVDQSGGVVTVTWIDMRRFGNATDRFSFQAILFSNGSVQYNYGTTFPGTGFTGRYVGISIGNGVGTTSEPNRDLSVAATTSGTVGMLYQNFTGTAPHVFDLAGQSLTISPNGTGGYVTSALVPYVPPPCASNVAYGAGCYGPELRSSFAQSFAGSPAAKTALDGNALRFTLTPTGYTANWIPGGASGYVAPSGAETLTGLGDDAALTITPSVAIPVPGGTEAQWTIMSNGVLTAAASSNNGTSFSPSLSAMAGAAAPALGFYVWRDWNPVEAGSGPIVYEELSGVLYVTWNGVEAYGTPSPNPGTFQYQVNLTTGEVTIVVVSFEASTSTSTVVVGCTLAGVGATPPSSTLATATPFTLGPDVVLTAMALSASPTPVSNGLSGTTVTWTTSNIPEVQPAFGSYLGAHILSFGFSAPFDLGPSAPGCFVHILSLDIVTTLFGPTPTLTSTTFFPPGLPPGLKTYSQSCGLFDATFPLPNGQNPGGLLTSNAIESTVQAQ